MTANERRWPAWIYHHGSDPDPRLTLANERTFLAWIRTSLTLVAAGVAVDVVDLDLPATLHRGLAAALVLLGAVCALASWLRWARTERALRELRPPPPSPLGLLLAVSLPALSVVLLVALR